MSSLSTKTYYEILGVDQDASQLEIRAAYKEKLFNTHPDKVSNKELDNVSSLIPLIKEAYKALADSENRKEYDEELSQLFKKNGLISTGEGLDLFTLDDFTCIEEEDSVTFKKDCPRCTTREGFLLTEYDLANNGSLDGLGGQDIIVQCSACSLWLKVKYFDLEEDQE